MRLEKCQGMGQSCTRSIVPSDQMSSVGQSDGTIFIRYSGSLVKKAIKINPNEGLVVLLERAVLAFSLDHDQFIDKYSLMLQGRPIDLATCLRFSSITYGSTLELVRRSGKRVEGSKTTTTSSMISLCLHEMESNQRYKLEVNSLAVTLFELLLLFEDEFSIQLFNKKKGYLPVVHVNGTTYEASSMPKYSLAVVGGRNALLRLSFVKSTENVDSLLQEARENGIERFLQKPTAQPNSHTISNENQIQTLTELTDEPVLDRKFVILPHLPHNDFPPESDSFFNLSAQEIQLQYNKQIQDTTRRQNAPLQSARLLAERKEQKRRDKYKECIIRFRFDDNSAIDATFLPEEKISQLYKFIQQQKSISTPQFTIPGQIDDLLVYQNVSLFDAGLVPRALVIVKEI